MMMSGIKTFRRRSFLGAGLAMLGTASYAKAIRSPDRPNILFVISDDQCWDMLGCIGGEVQTPHLDQLVQQGTFFSNAYNMGAWQPAVCMASRTMLATGRALWNAEAYYRSNLRDKTDFWSNRFHQAGYTTYFAGKWHVSKIKPDKIYDVTGSVRPAMPDYADPALGGKYKWNQRGAGYFRPAASGQDNWDPSDPIFGGQWEGGRHWSEVLGDEGVAFLESAAGSDQPFFMQLAFSAPHDPRQSPKRFVDMYPLDSIKLPENFVPENPYAEAMEVGKGTARDEDLAPFPRTPFAVKTHRREYFAIITHMDEQIGRILQALETTGQRENTVIVFTSDHGLACGQHGLMGKQNMFEHSMKPPLIFCGRGIPQGKTIDAPVYMQDLMPTTLDLAGIPIPPTVEFKSLLPVMQGREKNPYKVMYGAYKDKQRMVRKGDMKMVWYPAVDKYLLFDLSKDRFEMHDLSTNPEQAATLKNLKVELQRQQQLYKDPMVTGAVWSGSKQDGAQ
jgi:arylsulfatase A-like enzyme